MIKRRSHNHNKPISSLPASAFSFSWIPLTLILLLYTSGLCTGDDGDKIPSDAVENVTATTATTTTTKLNYTKTGNPQLDYVHDPNLPRELNGRNLSTYPFFSRVPPPGEINFPCDGLKDGFYANIEYKCQVYHQCLFGTRYDFLCANYTAFDQKTFICQFESEVDCINSALFHHKNDALYITPTTEPPPRYRQSGKRLRPAVQTYLPRSSGAKYDPPASADNADQSPKAVNNNNNQDEFEESEEEYAPDPPPRRRKQQQQGGRGRRRCKKGRCRGRNRPRARPRPSYYDYDEDYEDDDYDDYENEYYEERPNKRRRDKPKAGGRKVAGSKKVETSTEKIPTTEGTPSTTTVSTTEAPLLAVQDISSENVPLEPVDVDNAGKTREEIFTKSRPPPRIRPPVPRNERKKYDAMQGRPPTSTATQQSTTTTVEPQAIASKGKAAEEDEYYDDDYQQPSQQQSSTSKPKQSTSKPLPSTTGAPTTLSSRQRFVNRNLRPATTGITTTSTTTIRTTPSTTSTTERPTTPHRFTFTSSTTTTTEAPQYDYEYEYEDELPLSSSTEKSLPTVPTTTTTTTTTTQKPSRSNFRGNKRPSSVSSIQTSTSVTVNEQELPEDIQGQTDSDDASQNSINRRRSSWTRNQPSKTAASETTPNSIASTSERFSTKSIQRSPPQTYQEPVITVKSVPSSPKPPQEKGSEPLTSRIRPSRFWQRPSKVVATTITPLRKIEVTEAPVADYADYQDEPETASVPASRYNSQKTGSPSSSLPSVAVTERYQRPQVSGNSEEPYSGAPPQYSRTGHQYNNNNNNNNQQFLRQSTSPYRQPAPTPARVTIDPSNYASPYSPPGVTSSIRPEFISLLRDDEGPYYDDPPVSQQTQQSQVQPSQNSYSSSSSSSNRRQPPQRPQYFGNQPYHQTQKNLYGAAQESYPTFVNPPRGFNSNGNNGFMNDFRYPMMFLRGHK